MATGDIWFSYTNSTVTTWSFNNAPWPKAANTPLATTQFSESDDYFDR
jgi:hypothetical protein